MPAALLTAARCLEAFAERGVGNLAVEGEGDRRVPERRTRRGRDLPDELTVGLAASLEVALGHRTRREILRVLSRRGGSALSPTQLVHEKGVDASVAAASYHAKVFVKHDAAVIAEESWARGSTQCFYRSTVTKDREVKRILRAMERTDRSLRPPSV